MDPQRLNFGPSLNRGLVSVIPNQCTAQVTSKEPAEHHGPRFDDALQAILERFQCGAPRPGWLLSGIYFFSGLFVNPGIIIRGIIGEGL